MSMAKGMGAKSIEAGGEGDRGRGEEREVSARDIELGTTNDVTGIIRGGRRDADTTNEEDEAPPLT